MLKKFPGAKIVEAEKITTGEGNSAKVIFELAIEIGKDKHGIALDSTGKVMGDTD